MGFFDRLKKKASFKEGKKEEKKDKVKEKKAKEAKSKEAEYKTLQPKVEGMPESPVKGKGVKEKKKKEDTKDAYRILIKPLVTEKATDLVSQNKYAFEVAKNTNKIEIKKAIKSLYGVTVEDVNIVNMRGKRVSYGRISGKKKNWKKAIVTLKEDDKIEIYEGV